MEQINVKTHDDYGRKAGGLLAMIDKFKTFFGLKLSHLIFSGTEQLSLILQEKDITVQEGTMAAETTIQYLKRLRTDNTFRTFYSQVLEQSHDVTAPPTFIRYR